MLSIFLLTISELPLGKKEPKKRSKAYHKQGPQLDVYVPLAGIWIPHLREYYFLHIVVIQEHPCSWFNDAGKNWKGVTGFSIERWIFWKKRFGEIKSHDQASKKTKELAAEGERLINRIESEVV